MRFVTDRGGVELIEGDVLHLIDYCRRAELAGILAAMSGAQQDDRDVLLPGSVPGGEMETLRTYLQSLDPGKTGNHDLRMLGDALPG
ncbi:MAG: hypothetical protein KGL39_48320 [Patescibacteria group bacterium]|nr:hypothetical protein [Patescibacteria group bacterium]